MLRLQRGDTIIEVLLAVSVFSLVSILSMQIMQQGTDAAQRAVEITLVREQVDAQAEALRAAHEQYASILSEGLPTTDLPWLAIADKASSPVAASYNMQDTCPDMSSPTLAHQLPARAFTLEVAGAGSAKVLDNSSYQPAGSNANEPPYAQQLVFGSSPVSYGIWIEGSSTDVNNPTSKAPGRYTFRIRACWEGVGLSVPSTLETVVELYEVKDV